MDNSSRKIVTFIATITIAALIIMGARYYAESQKEPMSAVAEKEPASEAPPADLPPEEALEDGAADPENPEDELVEEDAELIMGEPSMNLEQGGTPGYAPPAQPETPPDAAPVAQ